MSLLPATPPPPGLVGLVLCAAIVVGTELGGLTAYGTPGTLSAAVWWLCDRSPEFTLLLTAALIALFLHLVLRVF